MVDFVLIVRVHVDELLCTKYYCFEEKILVGQTTENLLKSKNKKMPREEWQL